MSLGDQLPGALPAVLLPAQVLHLHRDQIRGQLRGQREREWCRPWPSPPPELAARLRPGKLTEGGAHAASADPSHPPCPPQIFHSDKILGDHEVSFLDIAFDEIPERYYRSLEVTGLRGGSSLGCPSPGPPVPGSWPRSAPQDPRFFSSAKTGRGPLREGWRQHTKPIMCSYKLVTVKFEVWGLQTRVEQFVHKVRAAEGGAGPAGGGC